MAFDYLPGMDQAHRRFCRCRRRRPKNLLERSRLGISSCSRRMKITPASSHTVATFQRLSKVGPPGFGAAVADEGRSLRRRSSTFVAARSAARRPVGGPPPNRFLFGAHQAPMSRSARCAIEAAPLARCTGRPSLAEDPPSIMPSTSQPLAMPVAMAADGSGDCGRPPRAGAAWAAQPTAAGFLSGLEMHEAGNLAVEILRKPAPRTRGINAHPR